MTALTDAALNGGSCQLRSRNSRMPWNTPQSTSTLARSASIRYLEPVTVPAAPQNESDDIFWVRLFSESKISEFTKHVYQGINTVVVRCQGEVSTGRAPQQSERRPLDFPPRLYSLIIPIRKVSERTINEKNKTSLQFSHHHTGGSAWRNHGPKSGAFPIAQGFERAGKSCARLKLVCPIRRSLFRLSQRPLFKCRAVE